MFDDLVKSVLTHRHAAGCPEIARDERDDAERQIRSLLRAFDEVTDAAPPGLSADELTAQRSSTHSWSLLGSAFCQNSKALAGSCPARLTHSLRAGCGGSFSVLRIASLAHSTPAMSPGVSYAQPRRPLNS
jgi:hypothetical protein